MTRGRDSDIWMTTESIGDSASAADDISRGAPATRRRELLSLAGVLGLTVLTFAAFLFGIFGGWA